MDEASKPIIKGDLRALIRISVPLMLFLFCEALTLFCERIFLSYHSIDSVHGSLSASYLAKIFQAPCIAIGAMGQVFVGFYQGSGEYKQIGPCVWQLIWFSFLSFLITLPLSYLVSSWYFRGTAIEKIGVECFLILCFRKFSISFKYCAFFILSWKGKNLTCYKCDASKLCFKFVLKLVTDFWGGRNHSSFRSQRSCSCTMYKLRCHLLLFFWVLF